MGDRTNNRIIGYSTSRRYYHFFLNYYKEKAKHYGNDIKPIFQGWTAHRIENLSIHDRMLDGFDLDLIHGLEFNDNEEMGRSHLRRYRKLGNNNLEGIERHQDSFDSFVTRNLQKITDDLHQGIPASLHEQDANHQTSFFFFDNILEHIWRTFHGEVRTLETELQGTNHMLLRNPGRTMIAHGMFNDIEQLRNFLNRYTPLAIIRLQEISQRRNDLESHYNDFARAVNRIMRDIEWNKPLKGKCGWERGFWSIR